MRKSSKFSSNFNQTLFESALFNLFDAVKIEIMQYVDLKVYVIKAKTVALVATACATFELCVLGWRIYPFILYIKVVIVMIYFLKNSLLLISSTILFY